MSKANAYPYLFEPSKIVYNLIHVEFLNMHGNNKLGRWTTEYDVTYDTVKQLYIALVLNS